MTCRSSLILAVLGCCAMPIVSMAQQPVSEGNFQVQTTGDLVTLCASQPSDRLYTAAQNFCQGYAVGVYRTLEAEQSGSAARLFCPPAQMPTRNEAIANFVRWAQASPTRLAMTPPDGIASYLAERLPGRAERAAG